ncbi:MAG: hypothetical protein C0506_16285, partial [Anaerolinea sp.]|nr:hypothetical protein [Anaerolinea sp.]
MTKAPPTFRLVCAPSMLEDLASRYSYRDGDGEIESLVAGVRELGWLTRDNLLKVAKWKSPRRLRLVAETPEATILEMTKVAFSAR